MIENLQWRYATKKFDPSKKLSEPQLQQILESLRLTPSSFGLQPWKFVLVNDPELRQQLLPHSWNQAQVVEASHLIVLCRKNTFDAEQIEHFVNLIASERNVDPSTLQAYSEVMKKSLLERTPAQLNEWMRGQVYIALGNLMTVCAMMKVDACPMEGFVPEEYDKVLELEKENLKSVLVCPVGFRAADDKYAALKKVRFPFEEVIVEK